MRKINPQAWEILTIDESTALSLQFTLHKSSWQAGEILDKSHYKYLEIRYRAEQFLRIFTHHFELYTELFPKELRIPQPLKVYLEQCILKRKKPHEAIAHVNTYYPNLFRTQIFEQLANLLGDWRNQENVFYFHFINILKEFDRWNNFRILPPNEQEPSAFKRRLKRTHKKNLQTLANLPYLSIKKMEKIYKNKNSNTYWPHIKDGLGVITPVKESCIKELTNMGLYVFTKKNIAEKYLLIVVPHITTLKKDCKMGLKFWPQYRDIVVLASNYQDIQNINPQRKWLCNASRKHEWSK